MPDSSSPPAHTLVTLGQFGERARPVNETLREAALVIGLGQVGLQAVARVHAMLSALLTRRDFTANVRLLGIARRRSLREEATLPREARLSLEMDTIQWSDVPGRYAQVGVAQWWPHSPRDREALKDPTLVRAYNRLLLYHNAALVGETLFKQVQWLYEVGSGRDLRLARRIYVLASLAEAEGSGMLFDVLARLRALLGERSAIVLGIFTLRAAPVANDPENILAMANVYATLREIDAVTLQPAMFPSSLPVIGHSLTRTPPRPALDMVLLTDEAAAQTTEAPENALAECVIMWMASSLTPPEKAPVLPQPLRVEPEMDRFTGYSTFGLAKLALPTRAAMDLAAVGLAHLTLKATKTAHTATATDWWSSQIITRARDALINFEVMRAPEVADRLRSWAYDLSAAGLSRQLETRTARGESSRMLDLVQAETRRLDREAVGLTSLEQSTVSTIPDSLRARIDTALNASLRDLQGVLYAAPVELAFQSGYGLIWTISALEDLSRLVRAELPDLERHLMEAEAAYQMSRQQLAEIATQHDSKGSGRIGSRKGPAAELDARAGEALSSTAEWIAAQARLDAWRALTRLVDGLIGQVRDVIPLVEQSSQGLREFEAACRRAMEETANRAPRFPSGVALTEKWFADGIGNVAGLGQLPPRDLLIQVYSAWGGVGVPPERRLGRFLQDVLEAARRALAGSFNFIDLYQFFDANNSSPLYQQALGRLPSAATPALVPGTDERHPAPHRFEIVREAPRAFSALLPPQQGVTRSFVPSPDPDEITVLRVLHNIMAEALPPLREVYRRAYERAGAEGMPLHIDRRWDSTMADLVQTTARREISTIWENLLTAILKDPTAAQRALDALVRALGVALDVRETTVVPRIAPDLRLVIYKLPAFRLKLPPPSCAVLFLCSNRNAAEVTEEVQRAIAPLPLEEPFAFVVNVTGRSDIDEIVEPLRRADFTILVLGEADIKHLIGARLPTRALSELVLEHVSLTTVSPFYTRGPVPEHMFFGRDRETSEVRSKLRTHSVALIGGRRIGKTSTLQRIQRLLKPVDSEYVPYYLDCHGATNYEALFWLISRRWEVDIPAQASPVQFEEVVSFLTARHPRKNIAILFDEVDSLLLFDRQADNHETLFRTFRSLSNEKRAQFVFSGEKWLMRAITDAYSALFNFTQAVRLEPLPPKVVHHLVAEPFEMLNVWIEESEQLINRIYQISAGHPNIVQMICQAMVEELDQTPQNAGLLTLEHLDKATSRRTLQEEIVQTIWGQMTPLARLVTLLWPEGARFLTLTEIEALLRDESIPQIPPDRLERVAKDLELYCFVRMRQGDKLELIPLAFPAILDFMTDKKRQIEIMRHQYQADPQGSA